MVEVALRDLSRTISTSQRQFRDVANDNNRSITKFAKDIAASFASQRKQSTDINNSIAESLNASQQTASKVDSTNSLLQESVTLQSRMVDELKNIRSSIRSLADAISQSGGLGSGTAGTGSSLMSAAGLKSAFSRVGLGGLTGKLVGVGAVGLAGAEAASLNRNAVETASQANASQRGGNADTSGAGKQSVSDLVRLAKEAGFNDQQAPIMAAIAAAESGGNPRAHNPNANTGDNSYGLWQINMLGRMGPERRRLFGIQNDEDLWDPKVNARAAKKIFDMQGFNAWSVYKTGKHIPFLGTAQKAAGSPSTPSTTAPGGQPPGATPQQSSTNTASAVTPNSPSTSSGRDASSSSSSSGTSSQSSDTTPAPSSGGAQSDSKPSGQGHAQALEKGVGSGLAKKLQEIESAFGGRLTVTSGHRDAGRNQAVGGAGNSAHLRGNAVDVKFNGGVQETLKLIEAASKAGIGGIGVYGPGSVHLDVESKRAWGSDYRRGSVPQWAEGAIRAHETNKWGEYDASAKVSEQNATRVGGGGMVGAGLGGMGMGGYGTGMSGGMMMNPMAMMGMMGGGKLGAIAGIVGALAPAIGGLFGSGIGDVTSGRSRAPQPQQPAVGGESAASLFDFKQFSMLSEDQQSSARFFEADRNERILRTQNIQQKAVESKAQEQSMQERLAAAPMPPQRPSEEQLGNNYLNASVPDYSSEISEKIEDWAEKLRRRFEEDL